MQNKITLVGHERKELLFPLTNLMHVVFKTLSKFCLCWSREKNRPDVSHCVT